MLAPEFPLQAASRPPRSSYRRGSLSLLLVPPGAPASPDHRLGYRCPRRGRVQAPWCAHGRLRQRPAFYLWGRGGRTTARWAQAPLLLPTEEPGPARAGLCPGSLGMPLGPQDTLQTSERPGRRARLSPCAGLSVQVGSGPGDQTLTNSAHLVSRPQRGPPAANFTVHPSCSPLPPADSRG